jgi:hypothetical protein
MQTTTAKNRYLGLIIGIGMFALCLFILAFWLRDITINSLLSVNWPSTGGTITASGISTQVTSRSDLNRPAIKYYTTLYSPAVNYTYMVNGHVFSGKTIYFGCCTSSSNQNGAVQVLQAYPVSSQVKIYYKPDDPSVAVLKTGLHNELIIYAAAIFCGLLGGILMIGYSLYNRHYHGLNESVL